MQTNPSPRFYLPELDGLRFIAFLLVFIHNASPILKGTFLEKFSEYSWFGVDLFFCLSGFLITKLLVTEQEQTGKINIRNFYIRRALRILPLYFFYVILATIFVVWVENRTENLGWYLIGHVTFTYNFIHVIFLPYSIASFIHLWSISFEVQFYVIAPWFLRKFLGIDRKQKWKLLTAFFIAESLIRLGMIVYDFHTDWIYFLPITRFDSLFGGFIIGLVFSGRKPIKLHGNILLLIGMLCLSMVFALPNININSLGLMITYPLIGIGTTLILLSIIGDKKSILAYLVVNRLFITLGRISYGLYVFHFRAFIISVLIVSWGLGVEVLQYPDHAFMVISLALLITIFVSFLSHLLIEKPFLAIKDQFSSN